MLAVNCVDDTNVLVIATPFHITTLPFTKPVPVAVRENGGVVELGLMRFTVVFGFNDVSVGAGPMDVPVTTSVRGFVVVLSGLVTVTLMVPAVATLDAST